MANPKKTKYGMPSNWSTVYNVALRAPSSPAAAMMAKAKANALPRGRKYDPWYHGFSYAGNNRYDFTWNGKTVCLKYSLDHGGWNCTCDEIGLTRFFDRHVPAVEIKTTLQSILGGHNG